jgi:hypothetical protein
MTRRAWCSPTGSTRTARPSAEFIRLGYAGAVALAASPYLARLMLDFHKIDPTAATVLADSSTLAGLACLAVHGNRLSGADLQRLCGQFRRGVVYA